MLSSSQVVLLIWILSAGNSHVMIIQTKNEELSSRVEILTSIKKGLEEELIESNKKISFFEENVKNLSTKKENKVVEEKDVDESEECGVDKNMIQVLNESEFINEEIQMTSHFCLKSVAHQ